MILAVLLALLLTPATMDAKKKQPKLDLTSLKTDSVNADVKKIKKDATVGQGLFATYFNEKTGKLYFEIPDSSYSRLYLLGSRITSTSDGSDYVAGQMNNSINSEMSKIANSINTDLNDNYISKMNKYINKLNSAIEKIRPILNNANYYLQPALTYDNVNGTMSMLSASKKYPTPFIGTGAKAIYMTSYTAEILAPSYKKFVAITDVIKDGKSAKAGDPECLTEFSKVKAANKIQYNGIDNMYAVLDGDQKAVALIVSSTGYTYEIAYSALDYSGKIATRKYYVKVQ